MISNHSLEQIRTQLPAGLESKSTEKIINVFEQLISSQSSQPQEQVIAMLPSFVQAIMDHPDREYICHHLIEKISFLDSQESTTASGQQSLSLKPDFQQQCRHAFLKQLKFFQNRHTLSRRLALSLEQQSQPQPKEPLMIKALDMLLDLITSFFAENTPSLKDSVDKKKKIRFLPPPPSGL